MESVVIFNDAALKIVLGPFLVGDALFDLAVQSSKEFLECSEVRQLLEPNKQNVVVMHILNGGKYYGLELAFEKVYHVRPQVLAIRAKRYQDERGNWQVDVGEIKEDFASATTLLIGDTIATGTTLAGVLQKLLDFFEDCGHSLPNIVVYSIAGTDKLFSSRFSLLAERLTKAGKHLKFFFANAKFNLADNGTDLGFEGAQYEKTAERIVHQTLGDFLPNMKCAIWDWGDRFINPGKHLEEVKHHFLNFDSSRVPEYLRKELTI